MCNSETHHNVMYILLLDTNNKCSKDQLCSGIYSTLEDDYISSLIFNSPTTNPPKTHLSSPIQQSANTLPSSSTASIHQKCMNGVSEQISKTIEQDVTVQKDKDPLLLILVNVATSFPS
jgi:hypothetical protein